jgi:hypothetical protein
MKKKYLATAVLALVALVSASAFANDQLTSGVTIPEGQVNVPVIVNNGVPNGTIQLWYTVVGSSFPCGAFAQFNLNLQDALGSGKLPSYPVALNLAQSGNGTPVQLTPTTSTFSVSDAAWSGSTPVNVSIDCSKLGIPTDGEEIVGNLNESTAPSGSHLDTVSTIQVHIKLVIPSSTACLKLYSFVTDADTGAVLDTVSLTVPHNKTYITASTPGTILADAMVVNTCPDPETFDLAVGLDPTWSTQPNNNAGNATFTYTETGELDPTVTGFTAPTSGGTKEGEAVCVQNVTLASGNSYIATVHSQINSGTPVSSLPSAFGFSSSLSTANTSCSSANYLPTTLVSPGNPATDSLTYTTQ